ncbi:hypothetical protein GCM10009038_31830 [Salinicola rhizosphaerae]|uniref:Uncharacterized protein n=1 Tax=Salinicola rhizosphaerae TaxID=1443141 RepID=A0ABQ3E9C4_9GAMM|nr:hypothetical protein GCM10009038_31830 [Salinicola rhizosphaerae]
MKPIEPGCLVMVIDATDSAYIGLTGTAVCIVDGAPYPGVYWEVYGSPLCHNQNCLMRIDGGEPESVDVREVLEVTA